MTGCPREGAIENPIEQGCGSGAVLRDMLGEMGKLDGCELPVLLGESWVLLSFSSCTMAARSATIFLCCLQSSSHVGASLNLTVFTRKESAGIRRVEVQAA